MAIADLQGLVDALASGLGRPVGVDDRHFRIIAYSSHVDEVDPVRLASILQREAPREVTEWLARLGIQDAEGPFRVPANPGFGMAARVCVPVRFDGVLLGYLWLIDEPVPLSDAALAEARRCAAELGLELFRVQRLEHEDRQRERELLQQLIGHGPGDSNDSASELLRGGFLAPAPAYVALVAQAFNRERSPAPDEVRVRLAAAAEHVRRSVAPHHLLVLIAGQQIVCVLACGDSMEPERRGLALGAAAARNLADTPGWTALVGASDPRASAQGLPGAHAEAQQALRVGRSLGTRGSLVRWGELGAYGTLSALLGERDANPLLPASLRRLLASPDADALVPTLECYLDLGGDARAAADMLHLHRSSLYGRVHRIEELAGIDLRCGEDRLELHLGLRLWRLGGGTVADTTGVEWGRRASRRSAVVPPDLEP